MNSFVLPCNYDEQSIVTGQVDICMNLFHSGRQLWWVWHGSGVCQIGTLAADARNDGEGMRKMMNKLNDFQHNADRKSTNQSAACDDTLALPVYVTFLAAGNWAGSFWWFTCSSWGVGMRELSTRMLRRKLAGEVKRISCVIHCSRREWTAVTES